jgi:hypothetical protein
MRARLPLIAAALSLSVLAGAAASSPAPARVASHTAGAHAFRLSVKVSGDGSGRVVSTPAGISCPATCDWYFLHDATVMLEAVPVAGSFFAGWEGDECQGLFPCSVGMQLDVYLTAVFSVGTAPPAPPGVPPPPPPTPTPPPQPAPHAPRAPRLVPLDLATTARTAKPGTTFSAGVIVARTDTGQFLTRGTIACTATIARKPVALAGRAFSRRLGGVKRADPMAVCSWRIPRRPSGTTLRAGISVTFDGLVARESFTKRIR